jgi:hypothetical protein
MSGLLLEGRNRKVNSHFTMYGCPFSRFSSYSVADHNAHEGPIVSQGGHPAYLHRKGILDKESTVALFPWMSIKEPSYSREGEGRC